MKFLPALAAMFLLSSSPALLAQEFKLPPERGAAEDALNYSCEQLDAEIAKVKKYIEIVQGESQLVMDGSSSAAGMALAENGLPRGEAAARANERLNHLDKIRKDKNCPTPAPAPKRAKPEK